ncbi:sigma-54-dependent Fis family transcriptional regulator [Klenkia brasiliensis]|uniref:Transcriptional regulator of acetoin/glycerol metabolism n=1 Tax=Klenkia brasiliensis TaxID=333142 RepID=A0A1G7S7H3_9ACTN|nr:helix-turn-helix domain-containing protein [Klenkia brasiliensis]SDG18892.1 Transcriptional regulator of acetoin/glycerol metabolism [Klenkia brasiliensis]
MDGVGRGGQAALQRWDDGDDWIRAVHGARQALHERVGQLVDPAGAVRPVVYESWRRSLLQGLDPDKVSPGYYPDVELDSPLARVVAPVVEKRAAALEQAMCSLALTDNDGRLLQRWVPDRVFAGRLDALNIVPAFSVAESHVGTTSAIALLSGKPVLVRGPEHYSEAYHALSCAGAPIFHPVTRRIVGSLDLTCRLADSSPVVLSWVMELVAEVQRCMRTAATRTEQLLLDAYLAHNRDARHPLVVLDQRTIISNTAAARLLGDVDQALLWEHASRAVMDRHQPGVVQLGNGARVTLDVRPVVDGGLPIGAVVALRRQLEPAPRRRAPTAVPYLPGLVGTSSSWRTACAQAQHARSAGRVLVVGEPGSGRLAVARAIAASSAVQVVQVPTTVEVATTAAVDRWLATVETTAAGSGKTLVLRHADLLPPAVAEATRVALGRRRGGQVIATSRVGRFTADGEHPLLGGFDEVVEVPALRNRLEDLPLLLTVFTERSGQVGRELRWMPDAVQALSRLPWGGNAAALAAVVERVVTRRPDGGPVTASDLPADLVARTSRRALARMEQAEAAAITRALQDAGGNKFRAAESLGIARSTLYRKVRALGIDLSSATW